MRDGSAADRGTRLGFDCRATHHFGQTFHRPVLMLKRYNCLGFRITAHATGALRPPCDLAMAFSTAGQ